MRAHPLEKTYSRSPALRPQSVPGAVIDGAYTCSPLRTTRAKGVRSGTPRPPRARPPAPARPPAAPRHRAGGPLPAPAPRLPGPARSGTRWLRKERKNRKQNFLAADGHQLHILQMPPSKNKPAAAAPGRLTPAHSSALPQPPSSLTPGGTDAPVTAHPGIPAPASPLLVPTHSLLLRLEPASGQVAGSSPPGDPQSTSPLLFHLVPISAVRPGLRGSSSPVAAPQITLTPPRLS